jgi:ribosomal protein S11
MGGVFMTGTEKAKLATLRTLAEVYLKIGAIKDVQRALDDMRDVLEGRGE